MSHSIDDLKSEVSDAADQSKDALLEGADRAKSAVESGKGYVAANPVPIIAGALAIGFVLGLLVPREKPSAASLLEGRIDELKDLLASLKSKVSASAEDGYSDVSTAITDAVKKAKKRFNRS